MTHIVRTTHVQRLLANALDLARRCHAKTEGDDIGLAEHQRTADTTGSFGPHVVLLKAAADARHAADEMEAEAWSLIGLAQV